MLTIDVISDVICPWCFIGKRRLEKAWATARHRPLAPVPAQPGHAPRGHRPEGLPHQEIRELGAVAGARRPGGRRRAGRGDRVQLRPAWPARRTRSTRTGSSGSPASGAFRTRWSRPCSWPTSPTAATCPTGRRSLRWRPGPGSTGPRWTSCSRATRGWMSSGPGRNRPAASACRACRSSSSTEGRPVRCPAARVVPAGVRAGGRGGRGRGGVRG